MYILENLDYTIKILEEEQELFLQNRDLLERESRKLEVLRPTYMEFNELYGRFRENVNDIIAANSDLKEIKRMYNRGEIMQENFLLRNNQLKGRIQDSYINLKEDIFPKLKELASQISVSSASEEKIKEFEKERDGEINKIDKKIMGQNAVEMIKPYLKELIPTLIKKAITITTGVPL
ncbi:MAG: hypothetical protein KKG76_06550 [Euryarchaeota archaeon]|nr:hypothetical protein [Euryarchaeota archaeon]